MRLYYLHPTFFDLTCNECEKYLHVDGVPSRRAGLPVLRPAGVATPCWKCPLIPTDAPRRSRQYALEMSEKNRKAFTHYLECQAVGVWPDDAIVRRNARIIRVIQDDVASGKIDKMILLLSVGRAINGKRFGES